MWSLYIFALLSCLCLYFISEWFYCAIESHYISKRKNYSQALGYVEIEKHFNCKIKKISTRACFSILFLFISIVVMFIDLSVL